MERNTISVKEYIDALEAQRRYYEGVIRELINEFSAEKFKLHNNLLDKWRESSERDRGTFVSVEAFNALKSSFDIYKDTVTTANAITAKALALAEGKTKGFDAVRTGIIFVAGVVGTALAMWAALKGVH